jgi:hypothetical protein
MQVSGRTGAWLIVAGFVVSAGCALMPQKEPAPEELAIFFTASTGGEIEPCG